MKLKRRRKLITYLNIFDQPIRFNPFVFSRTFLLWAVLGLVGGFIIPLFFVGVGLGLILYVMFPSINSTLAIISCMAAINACVTRTPMSTTILLATLTGFGYFIPILFAIRAIFWLPEFLLSVPKWKNSMERC